MAAHDDGRANAGWEALGFREPRTPNGNRIRHVAQIGFRTEPDGTESRVHLGYSAEGFHAAVETTREGRVTWEPYRWGKAHLSIPAATEEAWKEVFESDLKE